MKIVIPATKQRHAWLQEHVCPKLTNEKQLLQTKVEHMGNSVSLETELKSECGKQLYPTEL